MKPIFKKLLLCVLSLALIAGLAFGGVYLWQIQPQPIYKGDFNENIPYEKYIKPQELPEDEPVFNVHDYAVDGQKDWTKAINEAIKYAGVSGGGIVLLEGGEFLSGTVNLRDNITLWIAPDASLIASTQFRDFDGSLIKAEGCENIRITGGGTINGQGEYFVKRPKEQPRLEPFEVTDIRGLTTEYYARIRMGRLGRPNSMVWLRNCDNLLVDNIILYNSMHWTLKIVLSENVEVRNVVVNSNLHVANTDGIDIVGSQNVLVEHCFISTADDGIVIKNKKEKNPKPVKNVLIRDCEIQTCVNAFKIGTETYTEISDVRVENIRASLPGLYPGSVSGMSIISMDGAYVHDITIDGFYMEGVTCPLFVRLGDRNRWRDQKGMGRLENITVKNVSAVDAELPMLISGVTSKGKTQYVKNVNLSNFDIIYRDNQEYIELRDEIPELARDYPENWRFLDVPAYGLWARHIDGLTLENIKVTPRSVNTREMFSLNDDVLNLNNFVQEAVK
ncbi:MAG: glycosyl hydrolase family 28 protein [Oscillospiraceae bacterium]|nr:glycosyl hydrolase family 28 protein [Oscillospiraceae bacterium]